MGIKSNQSPAKNNVHEVHFVFSDAFFQNDSNNRAVLISSSNSNAASAIPRETYAYLASKKEPPRYVDGLKRGNWLPNFSGSPGSRMQMDATVPIMQQPEDAPFKPSDAFDPEIFNQHYHKNSE